MKFLINLIKETNKINAQGWDAITKECERIYPNQTNQSIMEH